MSDPQSPQPSPGPSPYPPQQQIPAPQPGYSGYAGHPGGPVDPPAAGTDNPLGRIALIIAIVSLVLGLGFSLTQPFLFGTAERYAMMAIFSAVHLLLALVLDGTALVLGIIALRQNAPKGAAGIAVGLAIAGLVGALLGWSIPLLYSVIPYS